MTKLGVGKIIKVMSEKINKIIVERWNGKNMESYLQDRSRKFLEDLRNEVASVLSEETHVKLTKTVNHDKIMVLEEFLGSIHKKIKEKPLSKTAKKRIEIGNVIKFLIEEFDAEIDDGEGGRFDISIGAYDGEFHRRDYNVCFWQTMKLGSGFSMEDYEARETAVLFENEVGYTTHHLVGNITILLLILLMWWFKKTKHKTLMDPTLKDIIITITLIVAFVIMMFYGSYLRENPNEVIKLF